MDNERVRVDVISEGNAPLSASSLPLSVPSAYVRAATAQGLVSFDQEGRVVPGLAARWMVTEGGDAYVFRLRKTRWNNGREITAGDVARILTARIAEVRRKGQGQGLENIVKVERKTGRVLQITLNAPAPHLLENLALPELGLIDEKAGSGPMMAKGTTEGTELRWRTDAGIDEVQSSDQRILLNQNFASIALARYIQGKSDLVTNGGFANLPLLTAADLPEDTRTIGPVMGIFGLLFVEDGPFLSEASNREAMMMALDRPRMLSAFGNVEWRESIDIIPDYITDRAIIDPPEWAASDITARKGRARQIIAQWKSAKGSIDPLRIAMPKGPGARILFAWIQADLRAVGVDVVKVDPSANADIRLIDRIAYNSSAVWFLDQLSCRQTRICDISADSYLRDAMLASDPIERQTLISAAQKIVQEKYSFIPIAEPLRWSVHRDELLGYTPNRRGWHYLQRLGSGPT